ncbi:MULTISPECIES: hypothetical protein [unclassified Microbacterium]|uniref:hypothetical protein n=1 Tax=unclassified Microbacterium TaxID=2609290 RepID=UPI00214CAC04|nr:MULTISPECIES: hypothetical protein [unclassified Microbacterium]MCR2808150.1 hypothetical protein [Microbacterium sp. zg.B185]WIM19384.1 hypothetical protein QNO12_00810 [Microbacterium sp. zg-B185]
MDESTTTRSRWGRAHFGGGSATLLGASLLMGGLVSAGAGGLFVSVTPTERPILAFALVMVGTFPVATALGWVLFVDRATLSEALENPDDSVESFWYHKAASGAFHDLLIVGGLGAAGFSLLQIEASVGLVLAGVLLFTMLDVAARYLWLKKSAT